jgi:enamine deaminase RidA (YjgF/YER057c/UK114 family)
MAKVITSAVLGKPLGMYSHGMTAPAGEIVVVAGQVGLRPDGQVAGPDVRAQTRQALDNVGAVLEAARCGWGEVVRLQTFLTSAEDIPAFMAARGEIFPGLFPGGAYPPNTLLVVSRLVRPELKIEIEAMAVRRARAAAPRRPAKRPARRKRR